MFAVMAKRKIRRELNRIKIQLELQGKSQEWLKERLKVSYVTVNKWCNNATQPRLEILYDIARILKVSIHDLLNE